MTNQTNTSSEQSSVHPEVLNSVHTNRVNRTVKLFKRNFLSVLYRVFIVSYLDKISFQAIDQDLFYALNSLYWLAPREVDKLLKTHNSLNSAEDLNKFNAELMQLFTNINEKFLNQNFAVSSFTHSQLQSLIAVMSNGSSETADAEIIKINEKLQQLGLSSIDEDSEKLLSTTTRIKSILEKAVKAIDKNQIKSSSLLQKFSDTEIKILIALAQTSTIEQHQLIADELLHKWKNNRKSAVVRLKEIKIRLNRFSEKNNYSQRIFTAKYAIFAQLSQDKKCFIEKVNKCLNGIRRNSEEIEGPLIRIDKKYPDGLNEYSLLTATEMHYLYTKITEPEIKKYLESVKIDQENAIYEVCDWNNNSDKKELIKNKEQLRKTKHRKYLIAIGLSLGVGILETISTIYPYGAEFFKTTSSFGILNLLVPIILLDLLLFIPSIYDDLTEKYHNWRIQFSGEEKKKSPSQKFLFVIKTIILLPYSIIDLLDSGLGAILRNTYNTIKLLITNPKQSWNNVKNWFHTTRKYLKEHSWQDIAHSAWQTFTHDIALNIFSRGYAFGQGTIVVAVILKFAATIFALNPISGPVIAVAITLALLSYCANLRFNKQQLKKAFEEKFWRKFPLYKAWFEYKNLKDANNIKAKAIVIAKITGYLLFTAVVALGAFLIYWGTAAIYQASILDIFSVLHDVGAITYNLGLILACILVTQIIMQIPNGIFYLKNFFISAEVVLKVIVFPFKVLFNKDTRENCIAVKNKFELFLYDKAGIDDKNKINKFRLGKLIGGGSLFLLAIIFIVYSCFINSKASAEGSEKLSQLLHDLVPHVGHNKITDFMLNHKIFKWFFEFFGALFLGEVSFYLNAAEAYIQSPQMHVPENIVAKEHGAGASSIYPDAAAVDDDASKPNQVCAL